MGYGLARVEGNGQSVYIYYIYVYTRKYSIIYIYILRMCAPIKPKGPEEWVGREGMIKLRGQLYFIGILHTVTHRLTERREGMAAAERFCGDRSTGSYMMQGGRGWGV